MAPFTVVFLISACGLVYELVAGALASYVLGDSVTQFSTVIGAYLSAMGLGAWLSRYVVDERAARVFVETEIAVALIGGFSAPALFVAFGHLHFFRPALYALVIAIGTLVGLEIPLLLRILRRRLDFKELVARVLSFDYIGALFASVLFPVLLVPRLGLVRTSLVFGAINAVVGLWSTWILQAELSGRVRGARVRCGATLALLFAGLAGAERLTMLAEEGLFSDPIVFTRQSAYQRIVLTHGRASFQLFLDGNLQFSSADEYRYHEALVHPAMSTATRRENVLVLGGGDGLAVREILRYPEVKRVVLVDIDPAMTELALRVPAVRELNRGALADPRVRIVNADAMAWLGKSAEKFDAVIVDFPDPNNFSLGKLYTTRFYRLLRARLAPGAAVGIQSTSPLFSRRSFWCIERTLRDAGFAVRPYHAFVPSFGEWGFMLAAAEPFPVPARTLPGLRFLSDENIASLFVLGPDLARLPVETNRLNNQVLVQYYEGEWRRWN